MKSLWIALTDLPLDGKKFSVTTKLPEPHHDRKDVAVIPEQISSPHVLQDQIPALLEIGVVDGFLFWIEFQLFQCD
jgi:hypothetical protein